MASVSEKFFSCLKKAKQILAIRRENKLNSKELNYGIWERYADCYDPMLSQHEEMKDKRKLATQNQEREIHLHVNSDLASSRSNISTKTISDTNNTSS
jgi:hypothetical protein